MVHRFLVAGLLFLLMAPVAAQPPVCGPPPPYMDEPLHWEVHDENGPMGYDIHVTESWTLEGMTAYFIEARAGGGAVLGTGMILDDGNGCTVTAFDDNTGNVVEWTWEADYYSWSNGTKQRYFYPIW